MSSVIQLFDALPDQTAPSHLYADEHVLEPCVRCSGTGVEKFPGPSWSPRRLLWDPTCRDCRGGGKRLIWVGAAIEVSP